MMSEWSRIIMSGSRAIARSLESEEGMHLFAATLLTVLATASAHAQSITITRGGSRSSQQARAEQFTGAVRVETLWEAMAPSDTSGASVTFEPGARTAWHTHPRGQILIVTAGTGRVQRWGDPIEEIRQGDVVRIPPGQKHWHGASPNGSMTHTAVTEQANGTRVEWMEHVTDEQYGAPSATTGAEPRATEPSRAQMLVGDFAPKLAELTDTVLFGDVYQRPGLSQRDRALVTVSALVALNRPDQLRSHLVRAQANGVTKAELAEAITQLAFYAGWPNAMTAAQVAKEVVK
jgi:4-carboxymuconolactone decarboxylase